MNKKFDFSFGTLLNNKTFSIALSVIASVLVWFSVASMASDAAVTVRNVPVVVDIEDSALARLDLEPVTETAFSVDVEIVGPSTVVGVVNASDIQVVAKLNNVSGPGTYSLALEGTDVKGRGFEVRGTVPETILMRFDHMVEKTLDVQLELSGLSVESGYLLQQEYVYPSEITVSGPATEMANVSSCLVQIGFDEPLAQTTVMDAPIKLINANGNEVATTNLSISSTNASVTLPILKRKTIPVTFDFLNVPPQFDLNTLKYDIIPEYIEVAGPVTSINGLTELHLGYVDIRSLEPDASLYYTPSLPPGYISVEDIRGIDVEFISDGFSSKLLNVSQIRWINQPEDYNIRSLQKTIYGVTVYGPKDTVSTLTGKDLVAEIDMNEVDIRTGAVTVPVTILLPNSDSCWAYGEYTTVIELTEK